MKEHQLERVTRMLITGCLATVSFMCCPSFATEVVKGNMNGLEIAIDKDTGCITSLSYPATGTILEASKDMSGLLDVAYPIEAFTPMRLASMFSKAKVTTSKDQVTIIYDQLGPSRSNFDLPSGEVIARVSLRAAPDGRSVIVTCKIENKSSGHIPQILFPDLQGLRPFAGESQTKLRLSNKVDLPFILGAKPGNLAFWGWKFYSSGGYSSDNPLRWLDFGGYKGGISVFQKKWGRSLRPKIGVQYPKLSDPTGLRLVWEHRHTIEPGQTWESGEFWLTPHEGGWAKGIEVFREYVRQVKPPRKLPRSIRDSIGNRTAWMIQPTETDPNRAAFKYKDIPLLAKDAKDHGLEDLVLWGWTQYFELPITTRDELGSKQDFLDGVKAAKELGVNVIPFISVQWLTKKHLKKYGVPPETARADWVYHPEYIPKMKPYYMGGQYPVSFWELKRMKSDNKPWLQDVKKTLVEWIDEGIYSFCWDVCLTSEEFFNVIKDVRALARSHDPESSFSGEAHESLELHCEILDFTWNAKGPTADPVLSVLKTPRANVLIVDSVETTKLGFCKGQYLTLWVPKPGHPAGTGLLAQQPELSKEVKECSKLRKQFLDYFVKGNFIGDSVLEESAPVPVVAHQLEDRLLIFVVNDRAKTQAVDFQSNLGLWLPDAEQYRVRKYDSTGQLMNESDIRAQHLKVSTETLAKHDLAIYEVLTKAKG